MQLKLVNAIMWVIEEGENVNPLSYDQFLIAGWPLALREDRVSKIFGTASKIRVIEFSNRSASSTSK